MNREITLIIEPDADIGFSFEVNGIEGMSPIELVGCLEVVKSYIIANDYAFRKPRGDS